MPYSIIRWVAERAKLVTLRDRVVGLFKFGKRAHMEEFVHAGHLYMNPLSHFIKMEAGPPQADRDEALDYSVPANGAQFNAKRNGEWSPLAKLTGPFRYRGPEPQIQNVFCMHVILESRCARYPEELIDRRNFAFGDAFVAFTDADEFLRRVQVEINDRNLQFKSACVDYIEADTYRGRMGVFGKYSAFDYQCEYRLAVLPGTGEPYSLHIGSIADIALLGKLSDINRELRFVPPNRLEIRRES